MKGFILIEHLDVPETVPLPFRDGPLPGNRAEGVGFQVDTGKFLSLGIENPHLDILPFRQRFHPVAQVALEQDGLGLERVARPECATVLEHAGVERGRGCLFLFRIKFAHENG